MPVSAAQLAAGANYQIQSYAKNDPIDQFTSARPLTDWLISMKEESSFGNGIFNEKVRFTNDSNYQNFTGDDQLSYNRKDTVRLAAYYHYESFDGFALNETELADNGIAMTDDKEAVMTDAEKIQLVNKIKEGYATMKDGWQEKFDLEMHRDGTQSALACPGIDLIVSTTPGSVTVGGIDGSVAANAYWKNNVNTGISTASAGNLLAQMEITWRQCIQFGKMGPPDKIVAGSAFIDAYAADVRAQSGTSFQVISPAKGGFTLDGSRDRLFFKGVEIEWDPSMDTLQSLDSPTVHWDKRCYFLHSKAMKLRPNRGRWLIKRMPPRVYDRHVHYFGTSADYGLTAKKRNSMAVLSIA